MRGFIIRRFTQKDTQRGDGLNLYAYVANNPIRYVDPIGYAKEGSTGAASCVNSGDAVDRKPRMGDADYDGLHLIFVHDGWHVVNELDETERVQASYIRCNEWLTQLDEQGDVAHVVNNIHGDVTHLTGQQGQILNAYTYDAFGNMLSSSEQRVNPLTNAARSCLGTPVKRS